MICKISQMKLKICSGRYSWYEHFFTYYLLRSQPCKLRGCMIHQLCATFRDTHNLHAPTTHILSPAEANCYVILNFFLRFLLLNFYYFPCCKPFLNTFKKNYLKKKIRKFNFLGCRKYPLHAPDAAWQLKHFSKIKRKHFHSLEVTKFKTKKANFIVLNSLPNFWCLIYFGSI